MKKNFTFFIFIIFLFSNIFHANSIEPKQFIQDTVDRTAITLSGDLTKEQRIEELKKIAIERVDIIGIGFYSLGTHKKKLSENEIKEYQKVFAKYFLKSFASRLAEYSNPKINIISEKKINDNYTIISSVLIETNKRPEIKIEWRVYTKNKDKPLIRDLIIEGLSLARTQKEEFNSIIQSADSNIEVLFKSLRDFSNN